VCGIMSQYRSHASEIQPGDDSRVNARTTTRSGPRPALLSKSFTHSLLALSNLMCDLEPTAQVVFLAWIEFEDIDHLRHGHGYAAAVHRERHGIDSGIPHRKRLQFLPLRGIENRHSSRH
jgi:hypothetical protein